MKSIFKKFFASHPVVKQAIRFVGKEPLQLSGLHGSSLAFVVAALYKNTSEPFVIIFQDKEKAAYLLNDLQKLLGERETLFFPASIRHLTLENIAKPDTASLLMRTETLLATQRNKYLIVTYPEALAEAIVKKEEIRSKTIELKTGESVDFDFLIEMFEELGLTETDFVFEPGQYAVRGSIIDVFSFSDMNPYRLDFFGDTIESIRIFDTETQLSVKKIEKINIISNLHLREQADIQYDTFFEYSENPIVFIDDFNYLKLVINDYYEKHSALLEGREEKTSVVNFVDPEKFFASVPPNIIHLNNRELGIKRVKFSTSPQPAMRKKFDLLAKHLNEFEEKSYEIFVCSENKRQLQRLSEILQSEELEVNASFKPIEGSVYQGFSDDDIRIVLYTDHQIFERYYPYKLKTLSVQKAKEAQLLRRIKDLKPGDYVVHSDHGIGIFRGIVTIDNNGKKQEVVSISYKDGDNLFVGIHSLYKISKFKSEDSIPPTIHKLGSGVWSKLKNKTKRQIKDIARDLIKLYAQRMQKEGFAFSGDTYLQEALEASFIYDETPDQIKAIQEVKADMEKPVPMDRLICGDVGFGKTEIALRAAFKAVADGKQVALLCPTTVLAFQHFRTFSERLKDFPVTVDYLSRMRTAKETKQIIEKLKKGQIDIIIGTHRIVSKDVIFKDLGLLIIDEEQRFGVAVKERLRQMRPSIDTLTLTATPIPRTLEFSLMGARDLSILQTPPANRRPIITELHVFDVELIRKAVYYEVNRGGQVFFVQNNINSLPDFERLFAKCCPDVIVKTAHGRMKPTEIEKIITDFMQGKFDVLLSTTIIENGLDIPNANTIIINDAHRFGVSHLHQLRGRVGRSDRKAFCYLFAPPKHLLSPESRRRLEAIENFTELGSGFNIALQDLDIRGAGDLLGAQQSGFISNIGYETFKRILEEAMIELRTQEFKEVFNDDGNNEQNIFVADCQIVTDLDIGFPDEYISDTTEKLRLYKELETITDKESLEEFKNRLIDRFGKIPKKSEELLDTVLLRQKAKQMGIEKIILKQNTLITYFVSDKSSAFYNSDLFSKILTYVASCEKCEFKEKNDKLYLKINGIKTIYEALKFVERLRSQ